MVGLKLSFIFIAVLFIDGLVLPAFFGFRQSFLSLLILFVPVLYLGLTKETLVYGVVLAFVWESIRGLSIGDMAFPFLLVAVAIFLTQRILDIRHTYDTRFSLSKSVLIVLVAVVFIYAVSIGNFSYVISLIVAFEALALVLVFNFIFNKKNDYIS